MKYNISKEYARISTFKPPFHKGLFPIASKALEKSYIIASRNKNIKFTKHTVVSYDYKTINLYVYEPINIQTDQVLLYIHGGAFLFKGYPNHFKACERYCLEGNCKVVYVDYRLAYNFPYPTPIEDCFHAYKWILQNAKMLKINPNKIMVGGDSAGGCLALDVTFKSIDKKLPIPYKLMLVYPVCDQRMITKSMQEYIDTLMWNAKLNKEMWNIYVGNKTYISPNEHTDFSIFPPTYIETAEFDCLKDEAIELSQKLIEQNISVTLNNTIGTIHGFDMISCTTTENAIQQRIKFLK